MSSYSDPEFGYKKKIRSQLSFLKSMGVEVHIIDAALNSMNRVRSDYSGSGLVRTIERRKALAKKCAELVNAGSIDLIYTRYHGSDPVLLGFAKHYGFLMITEHQTKEMVELHLNRKPLRLLSEYLFGNAVLNRIAGIVGVTREIVDYEVHRSGKENIPFLINGNGIEVASVARKKALTFDGSNLELLCVAHVAKWHGLDRLIKGMAEYKGDVNVRLHIVGDGSEVPNLKKLVADLKLENSVAFHGFKAGKELNEYFDECHIAIGSLGLHRLGISEGSILKVREYCARGIPFLYGVRDSDFPQEFPYLLRVPSNEEPVDIGQVILFARRVCSDQSHSQFMREYAFANLDWSTKMKKLVDFMKDILENRARR